MERPVIEYTLKMQQNATASQQVLQAVTTLQNQIPVTRYVSVITGKSGKDLFKYVLQYYLIAYLLS